MKFTTKGLLFHQIVIFAHLSMVHYFYFTFENNYFLNKIYNIFKMLESCGQKSFNNTENPSDPTTTPGPNFPPPPPTTKSWIGPCLSQLDSCVSMDESCSTDSWCSVCSLPGASAVTSGLDSNKDNVESIEISPLK